MDFGDFTETKLWNEWIAPMITNYLASILTIAVIVGFTIFIQRV